MLAHLFAGTRNVGTAFVVNSTGVFAHMYGLTRDELEWILDAPPPSSSFPSLKTHELAEFGEYRTMRLVLRAYDLLQQGFVPDLTSEQNSDT